MKRFALFFIFCSLATNHAFATSNLIQVRPEIKLEVVEWGGDGPVIIFMAGLGHTAHVFETLAPRLSDRFRVLGITRRGFGSSSCPDSGYDLATLAEDIRLVMDGLKIDRAVLAGHSVGGDEMTKFASLYPDRLLALIYFDAAHDRVASRDSLSQYPVPPSKTPEPTEQELKSVTAYKAYYARVNGVEIPESDFLAICHWDSTGAFASWKAPGHVYEAITQSLEHPAYAKVETPALAIYGVNYPITELFADYDDRDSITQKQMRTYYQAAQRIEGLSREEFQEKVKDGKVVEIEGAGHSLYITHAARVEKEIRDFLSGLNP